MKKLKKPGSKQIARNNSILIVDDVAKNIQLVAKFLTKEGYNLFFAQSGETALKQIESRTFDLVLLDVMMPGMDGFEVCEKIKSTEKNKDIPVIFLTAKTDDEAIAQGFKIGGVDYVTKPFTPTELVARVKTHLELRAREKELKDLNNTKDTLLSVISHDLKTPFFNIMGIGELLLNDYQEYDENTIKELIGNMVDASRVSHILLDNLLNWTRIQTGKIIYEPEVVDVEELVKENLAFVHSQAKNKEVTCTYKLSGKIEVYADLNMFHTIVRNLVTNAIKYTPRGGKVEVSVEKGKKKATITVRDTGVGIPAERLESILNLTEFTTTPGTEMETGSGFGLILTREFVEKNKGEMSIESAVGEGSSFKFTLPLSDKTLASKEK